MEAVEGRTAPNNGWNGAFAVFDTIPLILLQLLPRSGPPQSGATNLMWCVYYPPHSLYSGKKKYVNPLKLLGFLNKLVIKFDLIL